MTTSDHQGSHDAIFAEAFRKLILIEGGYADNPLDSGGRTCYGITEQTAREHGYTGAMHQLSLSEAREIYESVYWRGRCLDKVAEVVPSVAEKLFDTGVNVGGRRSTRWLQLALNALSNRCRRWEELHVDGVLAQKTLLALRRAITKYRMERTLLKALNCIQGNYYIELALTREKDQAFLRGWLDNRITF